MKKIKNNIVLIVLLMLLTSHAFASNVSGEEDLAAFANPGDPGVDPGSTPINNYLFPMLLIGVAVGYSLSRKRKEIKN
jgi:hypothetical protein